ncbi:MAG: hypothetical protein KHZ15_08880 [Coprobacillus cateniformis]|uniref:hypothetical protein n=1 Tax=Longibaculum muris TaxID=1796628 RepID=UPI003AB84ABB|nr:hypothetical protein [Coprobacillus cateniformis]
MLKIAICDDDQECLKETSRMIELWAKDNHDKVKIDCFDNGDSLIITNNLDHYDLVFLDIL